MENISAERDLVGSPGSRARGTAVLARRRARGRKGVAWEGETLLRNCFNAAGRLIRIRDCTRAIPSIFALDAA